MKPKTSILMAVETVAGAAVGAAIAGPLGAVAGGMTARHISTNRRRQWEH